MADLPVNVELDVDVSSGSFADMACRRSALPTSVRAAASALTLCDARAADAHHAAYADDWSFRDALLKGPGRYRSAVIDDVQASPSSATDHAEIEDMVRAFFAAFTSGSDVPPDSTRSGRCFYPKR